MNSSLRLKLENHSFLGGVIAAIRFLPIATLAIHRGDFLPPQSAHIRSKSGRLLAISGSTISYPFPTATKNARLLSRFICLIEDKRFENHNGVDLIGILRAVVFNIRRGKIAQGGSTITQQLARTVFLSPHRSIIRKICEIWLARAIERKLPKHEILNAYCNYAYLGRGVSGFEAAARLIFRKRLTSLRTIELASLVPLLQSPNRNHPASNPLRFTQLAEQVNKKLGLMPEALPNVNPVNVASLRSPRLSQVVFNELRAKGISDAEVAQVTTTIDTKTQGALDRILKLETVSNKDIESIAVVFLSNESGDVLAESSWSHGSPTEHSPSFQGRIQPGSTFKTFCVIAALEQGYTPNYPLESAPFRSFLGKHSHNSKEWRVRNYRDQYVGSTTIGDALLHSDNTAFARLIEQLDRHSTAEVYERFGLCKAEHFTPSAVLGGLNEGLSLLQLATAYSALARNGVLIAPRLIKDVGFRDGTAEYFSSNPGVVVVDYAVVKQVQRLLASTAPCRNKSHFSGKTGTTRTGSIFAGYNEKVSAAIWINYRHPQDEHQNKGITARRLLERIGDALLGHTSSRLLEII